jgi:hypothetical protein
MVNPENPVINRVGNKKSINMADFSTTIQISTDDLAALKNHGYSLYAFKAVAASGSGAPTVWFKLDQGRLVTNNVLSWTEKYQGYNSTSQVMNYVQISANSIIDTDLGDLVTIDRNSGILSNSTNGSNGTISFLNNAQQEFTIGIKQTINGISNILCAFEIPGNGYMKVITPVAKIALIFSTQEIITATVIMKSMSSGALIDLTGTTSRTVNFSLANGWSANENPTWLSTFGASTDMSSLLIKS